MIRSARAIAILAAIAALPILPGCGEKASPGSVDTAPMERSFQGAEPDLKTSASRAIEAIKAGNYQAALTELQGLVSNVKLTPEQKTAVADTINRVRDRMAAGLKDAGKGIQGGAEKAGDALKNLGK